MQELDSEIPKKLCININFYFWRTIGFGAPIYPETVTNPRVIGCDNICVLMLRNNNAKFIVITTLMPSGGTIKLAIGAVSIINYLDLDSE